jgi:hypothetical protein
VRNYEWNHSHRSLGCFCRRANFLAANLDYYIYNRYIYHIPPGYRFLTLISTIRCTLVGHRLDISLILFKPTVSVGIKRIFATLPIWQSSMEGGGRVTPNLR